MAGGWEALEQWGDDVVRIEPLTGGVGVDEVWSVRVGGHLAVGRLGQRSDADLAWETGLLRHLDRADRPRPKPTGVASPAPCASCIGSRPGWPQRPGWRSSIGLLRAEKGTRVDLGAMPPEGVVRCRAAWARLAGRTTCVVHGDPNPGNIRMTADHVAMIDWDESHVDVPDLDLALPHNAAGLGDGAYDIAAQVRAAWEAAVCWDPSGTDQFAVKRLAQVRAV
jgi:hypothetical protein